MLTKTAHWTEDSTNYRLIATYGMEHIPGNSQPHFKITAELQSNIGIGWATEAFGCLHDEISKRLLALSPLVCYHLSSQDGLPVHYLANAKYWFKEGEWDILLNHIRWEEDKEDDPRDMNYDVFCQWLKDRIPLIQDDFHSSMSLYGIEYINI